MKSFVIYDKNDNNLICENKNNIPAICKNYFYDDNKKCKKHYNKIVEEGKICDYQCPYGFYTLYRENNIYTSLVIIEENLPKIKKKYRIMHKDFTINENVYNKKQLISLIDDIEKIEKDTKNSRECIHELSNIGGYINSMVYQIREKHRELYEEDDEIKAMLCLYDMMNYRISLSNSISEINYKKKIYKTHPMLDKLRIMMSYKAKKKNVRIDLQSEDLYIEGSTNLYLALFILLDNAIKYAPNNSEVNIYYGNKTSDNIEIVIENRGPIVEKNEIEKLVINGYRGKNAKDVKGQGIGLSIFDTICKKAGYNYRIQTKEMIKGENLFLITLKLKRKSKDEYNLSRKRYDDELY